MTILIVNVVPLRRVFTLSVAGFNKLMCGLCGHTLPLIQVDSVGTGEPQHTHRQVLNIINKCYYG